jgi:hypothetical protein
MEMKILCSESSNLVEKIELLAEWEDAEDSLDLE